MPPTASARQTDHIPPKELITKVRAIVARVGIRGAARELGIGRESVVRLHGALPVKAGTIAMVERALESAPAGRATR
jgi:hypothetical protein